jgi:hypothetical protein
MTPIRALLSAALLLLYQGGLYWLIKLLLRRRRHVDLPTALDARLPVVPWMVIFYVGSFPFWVGCYYAVARAGAAFWPLAAAVLLGNTAADVVFLLLPTRMERPPVTGRGFFRFALRAVYFFDTPENLFPSVHCLVSCLCALGVGTLAVPLFWKLAAHAFALGVYASTVLVRQHRAADVPAGVAVALCCWLLAVRIPALPALAERIFLAVLP